MAEVDLVWQIIGRKYSLVIDRDCEILLDAAKAWADGRRIQLLTDDDIWVDWPGHIKPDWALSDVWRQKPGRRSYTLKQAPELFAATAAINSPGSNFADLAKTLRMSVSTAQRRLEDGDFSWNAERARHQKAIMVTLSAAGYTAKRASVIMGVDDSAVHRMAKSLFGRKFREIATKV